MSESLTAEELRELQQMRDADTGVEDEGQPQDQGAIEEPGDSGPVEEPQPEPSVPEQRKVDKRALDEERRLRKQAQDAATEATRKHAEDMARMEERFRLLAGAMGEYNAQQAAKPAAPPVPAPEPEIPSFDTDPQGFIRGTFERHQRELAAAKAEIEALRAGTQQLTQAQQQARVLAELDDWTVAQANSYAAEQPDAMAALKHLSDVEAEVQRARGVPPEQIPGAVLNSVRSLAAQMRQRGGSFGKAVYEMAKATGYRPADAAAPAAPAAPGVPAAPARPAAPTAVERLLRGQEMAQSVGAMGGAPAGGTAVSAIANMDAESAEFRNLLADIRKQGPAAMRRIFGA